MKNLPVEFIPLSSGVHVRLVLSFCLCGTDHHWRCLCPHQAEWRVRFSLVLPQSLFRFFKKGPLEEPLGPPDAKVRFPPGPTRQQTLSSLMVRLQKNLVKAILALSLTIISIAKETHAFFEDDAKHSLPPLIITEIAAFEPSGYEWIEIFNQGEDTFDLTEISFFENSTAHGLKLVQGENPLPAGGYAIITQDDKKFMERFGAAELTIFDSSWGSLKENGEEIGLKDKDKNTIEFFTYPPSKKSSLKRLLTEPCRGTPPPSECFTEEGEPSPGRENFPAPIDIDGASAGMKASVEETTEESPVSPPTDDVSSLENQTSTEEPTSPENTSKTAETTAGVFNPTLNQPTNSQEGSSSIVRISEVSFNDPNRDWVEIFVEDDGNSGNGVSVAGFTLFESGVKKYEIPIGTFLKTGDYLVLPIEMGLTGGTQTLVLSHRDGSALSAVCWSSVTPSKKGVLAIEKLLKEGLWPSSDPLTCPRSDDVKKGFSVALTDAGWKIFQHPTPKALNIFQNRYPQAIITIQSGETVKESPLTINVTGEASYDPDGDELKFFWNFGDGSVENGANPSFHTYTTPGTYPLTLSVEDAFGAVAVTTLHITVLPKIEKETKGNAASKNTDDAEKRSFEKTLKKINEKNDDRLKAVEKRLSTIEKGLTVLIKRMEKDREFEKKMEKKLREEMKKTEKNFRKTLSRTAEKIIANIRREKQLPKVAKNTRAVASRKRVSFPRTSDGDRSLHIKINEIYPAPKPGEKSEEWIELVNLDEEPVLLSNWLLDDDEGGSKPYRFSDETIASGGFLLLEKSKTKLALNNVGDSVRLFDFEGNVVDEISYASAPPGKSYARLKNPENLVASLSAMPVSREYWDWIPDLTPGFENPSYDLLRGVVKSFLPDTRTILLAGGEGRRFEVSLEGEMPPLPFSEGTEVTLRAKRNGNGTYELRKIEDIKPAPVKENHFPWWYVVIGFIALGFVIQLVSVGKSLIPKIIDWFRKIR